VLASTIDTALHDHVRKDALGTVAGGGTGFPIARDPDTVRAPDAGFIRAARVPPVLSPKFFPGAPDLAVEVLSPDDRAGEVLAKVQDWLAAGSAAVWVIDPKTRTVSAYRGRSSVAVLAGHDVLDGGDLLPGFSLPLAELFAELGPA
jgi:Uma2 family endonuclease